MPLFRSCIVLSLILLLCYKLPAQESMSLLERRISCQIDSASVEHIIEKIVNDNDLFFSYNPDILPKEIKSVQLLNVTLEDLLRKLLPSEEYKIEIIDNQVIITLKDISPIKLSGIIVEGKDDDPIPYASLTIAGESIGTMTNMDGRFDFIIPRRFRDKPVSVRCMGFQTRELTQNELKENPKIKLEPFTIHLREIKVKPVSYTHLTLPTKRIV